MNVYLFQAALLCEKHGKATCDQLRASIKALHPEFDEANESTFDSDYFPKGPYPNGGGEADTPQHCDNCGLFLENPLTTDGDNYVREAVSLIPTLDALSNADSSWSEIADKADEIGHPHLAEWIRFYFAWGQ